jgi:hypothetical protein
MKRLNQIIEKLAGDAPKAAPLDRQLPEEQVAGRGTGLAAFEKADTHLLESIMQPQTVVFHKMVHPQPAIFADISRVLVQEILDLREALDFCELQLFNSESDASRGYRLVCEDSQCASPPFVPTWLRQRSGLNY